MFATPRRRAIAMTLLWGLGLGTLILGVGSRIAMRFIAEATTGASGFTIGGTATVVFLGLASGAAGALILLVARHFLWRRRFFTTVVFWAALAVLAFRELQPLDQVRLIAFLPLVTLFGVILQAVTYRYRPAQGTAG